MGEGIFFGRLDLGGVIKVDKMTLQDIQEDCSEEDIVNCEVTMTIRGGKTVTFEVSNVFSADWEEFN